MNPLKTILVLSLFFPIVYPLASNDFSGISPINTDDNRKKFALYDAMNCIGKPSDLSSDGIFRIGMVYEKQLTNRDTINNLIRLTLDDKKIAKYVKAVQDSVFKIICTDVEGWYGNKDVDPSELNSNLEKLFEPFRKTGNIQISNYGIPFSNLNVWRWTYDKIHDENTLLKRWISNNKKRMNAATVVDYFTPSVYIVDPNIETWKRNLQITVQEIRKIDKDKKIIVFLWTNYYDMKNNPYSREFISPEIWRQMLESVFLLCDGAIIWNSLLDKNGNRYQWDNENMQKLMKVTKDFTHEHRENIGNPFE